MNEDLDSTYMQKAYEKAVLGASLGEVPVGAVLVLKNEIIIETHNQVESLQDPTAHAEVLAIREACRQCGNWRLTGAVLYTTLEPCLMCLGASILSRIEKIVWCCPDFRHGAIISVVKALDTPHPIHKITQIRGGLVMESQVSCLMKSFFAKRRKEKSNG